MKQLGQDLPKEPPTQLTDKFAMKEKGENVVSTG